MKKRPQDFDSSEADALRAFAADAAQPSHAGCPPVALLRAAHAGALPEEMNQRVNAHVLSCPLCRQLQADLEAFEPPELTPAQTKQLYARILNTAGKEKARAARAGWGFLGRPAIALSAIAALALILLWRLDYLPFRRPAPQTPAQPAIARVPAENPPPTVFELKKPEVRVTAAALVWRGGGSDPRWAKDLGSAFDSYRSNDYAAAETKFARLATERPQSVEAAFYLGVCRLYLKQAGGAVQALERAQRVADESFASDVAWYLSLAYHQAGESAKARLLLTRLCKGQSEYATQACAGVQELEKRLPETPSRREP